MTTKSNSVKLKNDESFLKSWFSKTYVIIIAITIFSLIIRICSCQGLDKGGDAFWIWSLCRYLLEQGKAFAGPGIWDHRMTRWMLYIPMIVIQKLFGATPTAYYIWPFASSTITAIFLFLSGAKLISKTAGVFAGVIYILYPMMTLQGSQINPTGTAAMCISIAIYCFVRWKDSKKPVWLIFLSVMVFCGYGAKVTSLFFAPGFVLGIVYYSYQGKWKPNVFKPLIIFLAVFSVLFVVECLVFQKLTTTPGGRFGGLIKGRHGNVASRAESLDKKDTSWRGRANTLQEYVSYFNAYRKYLEPKNTFLLNLGFLAAILIFIFKIRRLYLLAFVFIPTYLLFTYGVLGTFPFFRPERINPRYYTAIYAISILMFICMAASIRNRITLSIFQNASEDGKLTLNVGTILCVVLLFYLAEIPYPTNNFSISRSNYKKVKQSREKHYPVLMEQSADPNRDWKYIKRYRAFYGETKTPFYSRPKLIKLKANDGKEGIYYLLELTPGPKIDNKYLLTSIDKMFTWKQIKN